MKARNLFKMGIALMFLFAAAAVFTQSAAADSGKSKSKSPVHLFADPTATVGKSKLERDGDGVEMELKSYLTPGNAYTIWWIIFNTPEGCNGACGEDDLFNDAATPSGLWATGDVAGNGKTEFEAELEEGSALGQVLWGPGLVSASGAEIHLIVRDHGPASSDPGILYAQLNTLLGGCDTYTCADVQFSVHQP